MVNTVPGGRCGHEFIWGDDVVVPSADTITYRGDVIGVRFDRNYVGNQTCIRDTAPGRSRCIWHSSDKNIRPNDIEYERKYNLGVVPDAQFCRQNDLDLSGLKLPYAQFDGEFKDLNLSGSILIYANFSGTTLNGINFDKAQLQDSTFVGSEIDVGRSWNEKTCFEAANVQGTKFEGTTFNEPIFKKATFDKNTSFDSDQSVSGGDFQNCDMNDVELNGIIARGCNFEGSNLSDGKFKSAVLENSTFSAVNGTGALFQNANMENVDMSGSNLKSANFTNAELDSINFSDVKVDYNTDFGEKSIYETKSQSVTSFEKENKRNLKAIWVYRALERLHRQNALTELASEFYIREKDLRRRQHRKEIRQDIDKNLINIQEQGECTYRYRFRIFRNYFKSELSRLSIRYGESPFQLGIFSLSLIMVFAAIFPFFGISKDGETIKYTFLTDSNLDWESQIPYAIDMIRYSFYSFIRTGQQSSSAVGYGGIFAGIESISGAAVIALLVFVLTRRATS